MSYILGKEDIMFFFFDENGTKEQSKESTNEMTLLDFQQVRYVWHNGEWYFSVVDVVGALTDSANPTDYLKKLRKRDSELAAYLGTNCPQVAMKTITGKMRKTLAANAKGILRIIQSIPSPKAEPFKLWMAQVGAQRLEEIENPELMRTRMRELYRAKGYSEEWIDLREQGMAARAELTDEWKKRGIKEHPEYAILTAEISKATFGLTPSEYKNFKGLSRPSENLRDHMTDMELVLTTLGEVSTREIVRAKDAQGFAENQKAAVEGGRIAGSARHELEKQIGKSVVSKTNFKEIPESEQRKRLNKAKKD